MARYTRLPETIPLADKDVDVDNDNDDSDELVSHDYTALIALPPHLVHQSLVLLALSLLVAVLVPVTLHISLARPLTNAQLAVLPYPDTRLGLDRAATLIPQVPRYHPVWPTHIARVNQKLKSAVYGDGVQVYISVEDSTIMEFPVPPAGADTCALTWTPPPQRSARTRDLLTKGDVSEIEAWSVISPHVGHPHPDPGIDFDALSWNTRPVRGELLGTLDLTARPNATTVEFVCPTTTGAEETLTVELRCLRVACHVSFKQVHMYPKMGFELLRRQY